MPIYQSQPKQNQSMVTPDGVRLDADVYYPDAGGSFPVLLMRQPYGRAIASTVVYAHPAWYAAHGFIVVIQDVRGRGTSEGEFHLFEHEAQDGSATVEWAAGLPQSNGYVGMYGFSYQGMTQLFAAEAAPTALKAIAPAMVGYHPYADWAYENGALLLQAGLGWAVQLAAETARLRGDRAAFQALYQASRQLPLTDETPARPGVLVQHAPDSFFHDWVAHPESDEYWNCLTPRLEHVDLPMLHIGGWFDPYLRGDIRLLQETSARSQYPQPCWIGPWGHIPWAQRIGDRDFGPTANSPIDQIQIEWFNHWLREPPQSSSISSSINLFEMGTNCWRQFTQWPSNRLQRWSLTSSGLAAINQTDGQLCWVESSSINDPTKHDLHDEVDTLVHDPWRPVPSLGGHAGIPAGPFNRARLDGRSDILTYTSAPFEQTLHVAGHIEVCLNCQSDRPTFDLSVTLAEVMPDGAVYPLTQGYGRFAGHTHRWLKCQLSLQPTCFAVLTGHALRLSISAACFPAYAMNPGTGATAKDTRVMDAQTITVTLRCDCGNATYLLLPTA